MQSQLPQDVTLFGAEDLRMIERVNEEITRNGRMAGRLEEPSLPLFTYDQEKEAGQ